jgi:hypothetical protein
MTKVIAIYDSCILYSAPLRDLFVRLAIQGLYEAKWTEEINEEWIRNLLKNRPDLTRKRLEQTKELMNAYVRDCLVDGYKKHIENLVLPDPDDRHVVAAAICAGAQVIITFNLVDFPKKYLAQHGIEAQHPDLFLRNLLGISPVRIMRVVRETRLSLKNPPRSVNEYLETLERQSLSKTVQYLRLHKDQL